MIYKEDTEFMLQDTLHKCLMCNGSAHECEKSVYRCDDTDCGYSWEVETCDD